MSRFTEITESARRPHKDWSNREIMQFHRFNPNGLLAKKSKLDETISQMAKEEKCKPGAIWAYGSLNTYAADRIRNLSQEKRVGTIKRMVAIEMMEDAIRDAEKFIAEVNKQHEVNAAEHGELCEKAFQSGYQNYIDTFPNESDRCASDLRHFCRNALWDLQIPDVNEEKLMIIIESKIKGLGLPDKATEYTLHVTAGPAYVKDENYKSYPLVLRAAGEYQGQTLGYLQPDKSYKQYPVEHIYIMDDSGSEDPVWSWHAEHEAQKVEEPVASVTPLQLAMLEKIAFDEFTPANGSMPSCAADTETWADSAIETAQDKGVFTSLLNAKLVWHSGKGREAGIGLTEEGYKTFCATTTKSGK